MSENNKNRNSYVNPGLRRNGRRKKRAQTIVLVSVIALFVVLAAIVTVLLLYKPTPNIDLPFRMDDSTIRFTDSSGNDIDHFERTEKYNFLILGKDRWAFNTDVMIIVSFDVTDGSISLMQIPRDTYIDIGRGNHKANSLLASFYNEAVRSKEEDPYGAAVKELEKALEQVFCITIDYYAMMDLNGFVEIVDAIGGVKMNVPERMYYRDPVQNLYINLYPGEQTLTGEQAEQFVRFRSGYVEGDIGRVDAQKLFISACIEQVKNNFTASTIANVVEKVLKHVTTDLELQQVVYFAKQALSVDLSKMTMLTIPGIQGRQYDTSGTWYYIVYRDAAIAAINKYFNSYNFDVTVDMFDRDDALYDTAGTYMHSLFLTKDAEEESYTADHAEDIYIYRYASSGTKSSAAAATEPPVSDSDQEDAAVIFTIGEKAEALDDPSADE